MLRSIVLLAAVALLALAAPAVADTANSVTHQAAHAKLDSGPQHTCAVLAAGAVRCWGRDDADGRLGLGSVTHGNLGDDEHPAVAGAISLGAVATAVTAGGKHSCAILTGGSVRCWGQGQYGALGNGLAEDVGDDEDPSSVAVLGLGAGRTATALSAGSAHTCALLDNGTVKCWGANSHGQLGYGDKNTKWTPAAAGVALPSKAIAVAAGGSNTCAIVDTGALYCWGFGDDGLLGTGDENDRLVPTPIAVGGDVSAIDVGYNHSCAIMAGTNALRCWGFGEYGELGYGDTANVGDDEVAGARGNIGLGAGRSARSVTAAVFSTCAQLDNGDLRCFGDGSWGELGTGKTDYIGDDELPATGPLTSPPAGRTFAATSAGSSFRCFSFDDASIRCAGATDDGETAEPDEWTGGLLDWADKPLPSVRAIRFTGGGSDLRLRFQHNYGGEVGVGLDRTIELHLNNAGPQATTGQNISIYTPSGLTVVSATPTHGTYANGLWSMEGSGMQPTAKRTITLVVRGKTVGSHTMEAAVAAQTGPADVDSNPGNPSYGEDDSAQDTTKVVPSADLSISTAVSTAEMPAKGKRTMVVTLSNAGPQAATNVEVDTAQAFGGGQWSTVSSSASHGTTQGGTWKVPSLAANTAATMTVTVTTPTAGNKQLGAKIADSDQPDVDTGDRQSVKTIPVVESADLLLKWDTPGYKLYPGDTGTLTLRTYNEGTASTSARVAISAPAGLTVTGVTGTGVTWDAAKGMATVAAFAGGGQHTMAVKVTGTAVGDHQLDAEVQSATKPDPDSTPGNGMGEDDAASVGMTVIARYVAPPKATPPATTPGTSTTPSRSSSSTSTYRPNQPPLVVRMSVGVAKRVARVTLTSNGADTATLMVERKVGAKWRKAMKTKPVRLTGRRTQVSLGKLKRGTYRLTLTTMRSSRNVVKQFKVR